MSTKAFYSFLFVICASLFLSCSSNNKPNVSAIVKPKLSINLYIETSASMAGYLNGQTEFKDIVTGLASKLKDLTADTLLFKIDTLNYFTINDNHWVSKFDNTNNFISSILNSKLMTSGSSLIHNILKQGIDTLNTSSVNILITDMILSYGSTEIKRNSKINVQNIDGLKNLIHSYFTEARNKKIGFGVFSFKSKFKGTYYDFSNNKHNIDTLRPFYAIFYGSSILLKKLIPRLKKLGFKYEHDFYSPLTSEVDYKILQTKKLGEWYLTSDRKNIEDVKINSKSPIKFLIALDFNSLPKFIDLNYLNTNLHINGPDIKIGSYKIYDSNEIKIETKDDIKNNLKTPTHYIEVNVLDIYKKYANLSFSLDYRIPEWIGAQSTLNDSNPVKEGIKTFGLEKFINGMYDAYNIDVKLINLTIKLGQ